MCSLHRNVPTFHEVRISVFRGCADRFTFPGEDAAIEFKVPGTMKDPKIRRDFVSEMEVYNVPDHKFSSGYFFLLTITENQSFCRDHSGNTCHDFRATLHSAPGSNRLPNPARR